MILTVVLDFILIGILIGSMVVGLRDGFIKAIAKPMRPIFSLGFALIFANSFAAVAVLPIVKEPIYNWISGILYDNLINLSPTATAEDLPTLIQVASTLCGVDMSDFTGGGEAVISAWVAQLALPLVGLVAIVISFIILLIISGIVLSIVLAILNAILEAGVLKVVNRVIGCVVCVFFAVFTARSIIALFDYAIALPQLAETNAVKNFTGGFIYNLFKQYTPIELLLNF